MDTILEEEKALAYRKYLKAVREVYTKPGIERDEIERIAFVAGWEAGLDLAAAAISSQRGMRMLAAVAIRSH
jgi:hypothetical protein